MVDYPRAKNILIEVKYREQAALPDDSAICEQCGEASAAIVVTKRANDYGVYHAPNRQELIRIPAFAFLYLLGNAEWHGYRGQGQHRCCGRCLWGNAPLYCNLQILLVYSLLDKMMEGHIEWL